jgi:hypothetical protein
MSVWLGEFFVVAGTDMRERALPTPDCASHLEKGVAKACIIAHDDEDAETRRSFILTVTLN